MPTSCKLQSVDNNVYYLYIPCIDLNGIPDHMRQILSLQEFKETQRMTNVQVRLPKKLREQAKQLAESQSTADRKLTESDVYRTAISVFFGS